MFDVARDTPRGAPRDAPQAALWNAESGRAESSPVPAWAVQSRAGLSKATDSPILQNTIHKETWVRVRETLVFSGLHFLSHSQCVRYSILPSSCVL